MCYDSADECHFLYFVDDAIDLFWSSYITPPLWKTHSSMLDCLRPTFFWKLVDNVRVPHLSSLFLAIDGSMQLLGLDFLGLSLIYASIPDGMHIFSSL